MKSKKKKNAFIAMAAVKAGQREDRREFRLGAVGYRSDGTIVHASNGPTALPDANVHAEVRLAKKLDVGSVVFVARVLANGSLAMAKPCAECEIVLRAKGVSKVYYTTSSGTIESMVP